MARKQSTVLPREIQIAFPVYIHPWLNLHPWGTLVSSLTKNSPWKIILPNSPSRVITSSVKYVQFGIHLHKLPSKPWSTPSSAHASILQTASSMGQARTSIDRLPVGPQLCCTFDPQNRQIRSDLVCNSTGPPLASNFPISFPCPFQAQFHHEQLPGWSSTGVLDWALPFREWHSSEAQPSVHHPRSSFLVPRFRKERSGRRGFSVSSPQLWNLLPVDIRLHHNEHQLFRRRLKTHYMQQSLLHHWGSMSPVRTLLLLLLPLLLLLTLLSNVTRLLETNPYVIVYVLDFSKAFDTVRHYTLLEKMGLAEYAGSNIQLVRYYNGHSHCTFFCDALSDLLDITASIIQGSGTGPASYVLNAADMHTIHEENVLVKFADDTDLVVAAANEGTCTAELMNIKDWATRNNLTLNESKSVEIVFRNLASKSKQTKATPTNSDGHHAEVWNKDAGSNTISEFFDEDSCWQRHHFLWPSFVCDENPEVTRSTTRVSACPLPVHHLVTAPVCISSVVRICEWGGCWEIGLVHTKVRQVVIRIAGSTVIPTAMWKERWHFVQINSFKQKPCSCESPSSSQENRLRSQDQSSWLCPALC